MKILRVISAGYLQGGAENGVVLTNKILISRGHKVKVVSSDVEPTVQHFSDVEFKSVYPTGIRKSIDAAFNFDAYRVVRNIVQDFKPDIVLLHTLSQPTASVLYALQGTPALLFVHGPELYTKSLLPWYLNKSDYRRGTYDVSDLTGIGKLHYWYFLYICRPFYLVALPRVSAVVALSGYTRSMLNSENIKAEYIPNGVGLLPFSPLPESACQILYAGRLEKYKGVDDLIKALPTIVAKNPAVRLLIAGTGSYEDDLRKLVTKLKLETIVDFGGQLDHASLGGAYRSSYLFVLPSTWPETFGKVGVEAMSVGRPVVATDVGGIRDWLEDGVNGYIVPPGNPVQLAEKISSILSSPELAERMSVNARSTAEKFSIEAMTDNIITLSKKAIKR